MKKILITVWTFTLGFVANAADSLSSPSSISNNYKTSLSAMAGDGTGTCLSQRNMGDGTGTCIATRTAMEMHDLNRLRVSLQVKSPEERALILNKLQEILNDEVSN